MPNNKKRKSIFNANNDVLDKYNSNKIKGLLALLIIIHHLSIYIKDTILLKVFTIVGVIAVSAFFFLFRIWTNDKLSKKKRII